MTPNTTSFWEPPVDVPTFGQDPVAVAANKTTARAAELAAVAALRIKYTPNEANVQTIGIESAVFEYRAEIVGGAQTSVTSLLFDYTTRPDSARILLQNSTGSTVQMFDAVIKGFPVERMSGDRGFIHDFFVDYESIQKNGEQILEWGNNYVINKEQTKKVATYLWKWHTQKKHLYTVSIAGACTYFEPGEWYDLRLGTAGTEEYVDALVECYAVRVSLAPGSVGRTSVSFRVVEQHFKDDSNAVTRYMASGGLSRLTQMARVAAQYSGERAEFYCDGTNDEVEIAAALASVSGKTNGGIVQLTEGTFNCSTFSMISNAELKGRGPQTILKANFGTALAGIIQCSSLTKPTISNMTLQGTVIAGQRTVGIRMTSCTDLTVTGISFKNIYNGISEDNGTVTRASIIKNTFDDMQYGVYAPLDAGSIVSENIMSNFRVHLSGDNGLRGVYLAGISTAGAVIIDRNTFYNIIASTGNIAVRAIDLGGFDKNQITRNVIYDLSGTAGSTVVGILTGGGDQNTISGNRIENVKQGAVTSSGCAITITGDKNMVQGNYCFNNGADTGIAATTGNFRDLGTSTMTNINSWQ